VNNKKSLKKENQIHNWIIFCWPFFSSWFNDDQY